MESLQTRVIRDRDGWHASTEIELGQSRIVRIDTRRVAGSTKLKTSASVMIENDGRLTHAVGYGSAMGDYSRLMRISAVPRATEKVVRAQHEEVLTRLDLLKKDIEAHYALQQQLKQADAAAAVEAA